MDLDERTGRLAAAGLRLFGPWPLDDEVVTPPDVAWSASACGPESGRVDLTFQDDDDDRVAKGNDGWLRVSRQFGLFDDADTFLLSVATGSDDDSPSQWFQARLTDGWDLIGLGAETGVLGYGRAVPASVMKSADGKVLIAATSYETSFSVFATST